jgi:hypothetical protein
MSAHRRSLVVVGVVTALTGLSPAAGHGQIAQAAVAVHADASGTLFRSRVDAYTVLRRQITADLLERGVDPTADSGREFRQRLGVALREARRRARPGEIFCPEIAGRLRSMVWQALQGEDDILSEVPAVRSVRVNDFYPEGEPLATVPPSLLRALEPLPQELQYRFLSNALILLDIDTALIVDFIPNAFERIS